MLENEEPWRPPIQEKIQENPKIGPEVPEVTIIGTETNKTPKNNNFLQRTITSDQAKKLKESNFIKKTAPHNIAVASSNSNNQFKLLNRPQVPDLTVLDDLENVSSAPQYTRRSTERVFTESYKEMLVNSHEQFLKQLNNKPSVEGIDNSSQKSEIRKRSPFFMQATTATQYKQNPLTKYAPKCDQLIISNQNRNANNTSSILIDFNKSSIDEKITKNQIEENDEVTFKKVAEMLSEIQKLTIPGNIQQNEISSVPTKACIVDELKNSHLILRKLAKNYLSTEEIIKYQVDNEFDEMNV